MASLAQQLKQAVVGTSIGRLAIEFSRRRGLNSVDAINPEAAQYIANGIIADRLIIGLCEPGQTFLDIGAHIGSVFSAAHAATTLKVLAIEADAGKAAALCAKFPYATVFPVAVGEVAGHAQFFLSEESGYNSLVASTGRSVTVDVRTLDDLVPDDLVDVVKIDIEGAELGALRGGERLFARGRPIVMFESAGTEVNSLGYSAQMLWQWFTDHNYKVFTPDRVAHNAPSMGLEAFLDAHEYPFRTINYFAIPVERRSAVKDKARAVLGVVA